VWHYCVLETSDGGYLLAGEDGSLCTVLEVSGSLLMNSDEEQEQKFDHIRQALHTRLSKKGHLMQVVLDYNPEYAYTEIAKKLTPSRLTAKNMGFRAIDNIFEDWGESVAGWCAVEKIYLVLWTRPFVLPPQDIRRAKGEMRKKNSKYSPPASRQIQNPGMMVMDIVNEHQSFVDNVKSTFRTVGINIRRMDSHEALLDIRRIIDKEFTADTWRPALPGDKVPLRYPDPDVPKSDLRSFLYPSLREQIFPREGLNYGQNCIRIGDRLHAPMMMVLPPQTPGGFDALFNRLREKNIPWRVSFMLDADGLKYMTWKHVMSTVLHFTSTVNKKFNASIDELKALEIDGEAIIRFRACFSTSVYADIPDAERKLNIRAAELSSAVQAWGTTDVTQLVGDPLLGFSSTVPALMYGSPAPSCAAPLDDIIRMMPFTRPSSPWDSGSVILRSPDGKIMPFHPFYPGSCHPGRPCPGRRAGYRDLCTGGGNPL